MTVLAGDTWGIPGPTFVVLYIGAAVVAFAATLLLRRSLSRGRRPARDLDTNEIAYLSGGAGQTLAAVLTGLRVSGRIEVDEDRIRVTQPVERDSGGLDGSILRAIRLRADDADQLLKSSYVRREMGEIERRLVSDGLLLGDRARSRWGLATLTLWAVLALGIVRADRRVGGRLPRRQGVGR